MMDVRYDGCMDVRYDVRYDGCMDVRYDVRYDMMYGMI